jgi:hypothetical protein
LTIIVLVVCVGVVYFPRLLEFRRTDDELIERLERDCGVALPRNLHVEHWCEPLVKELRTKIQFLRKETTGSAWVRIAQYHLALGKKDDAKSACRQSLRDWEKVPVSEKTRSRREYAVGACKSFLEQ